MEKGQQMTSSAFCSYRYTFMYIHIFKMQTSETVLFDCPHTDKNLWGVWLIRSFKTGYCCDANFDVHSNIM